MSAQWAIRLGGTDAMKIGPLRSRPWIEALETEGALWLRGGHLDEELERTLRSVPGARRFTVLPDGQLVQAGAEVPSGRLPGGSWTAIAEWITVELPRAALAGKLAGKATLAMVRCHVPRDSNVLWTTMPAWRDWALGASQVRLRRLAFAASADSEVVVRGAPVPPIKGRRFVERDGVGVEAGWTWSPALDAGVVREALGLARNALALLHSDGTRDHIPAEAFVHATRSAVRMSAEGVMDA